MIKKKKKTMGRLKKSSKPYLFKRSSTRFYYKAIEFFHFNSVKNHGLIILLTFLARALAVKIESNWDTECWGNNGKIRIETWKSCLKKPQKPQIWTSRRIREFEVSQETVELCAISDFLWEFDRSPENYKVRLRWQKVVILCKRWAILIQDLIESEKGP